VVITAVAHDWRVALDQALVRAVRALVRVWRRSQAHGRITQHAVGFDH
jgi:predicted RecB family endonuclease